MTPKLINSQTLLQWSNAPTKAEQTFFSRGKLSIFKNKLASPAFRWVWSIIKKHSEIKQPIPWSYTEPAHKYKYSQWRATSSFTECHHFQQQWRSAWGLTLGKLTFHTWTALTRVGSVCLRTVSLGSCATVHNLLIPWPDTLTNLIVPWCHCKTLYTKEPPRIRTFLLSLNLSQDTTKV